MTELEVGDIVINPIRDKEDSHMVCLILWIPRDYLPSFSPYIILTSFGKRGYPSLSTDKLIYLESKYLGKLKRHGKYPRSRLCPNCSGKSGNFDYLSITDIRAVMRKLSIYDNKYQCRICKGTFEVGEIA